MKRSLCMAGVLLVTTTLLAGCGNNSANNAANNAGRAGTNALHNAGTMGTNALHKAGRMGTSAANLVGLPGLTHGANLRSDRTLESRVNAIPGVGTSSVLVTGNTAYVLLNAGSTTGKGNNGPGTAGTSSLTDGRKMGTGPGTGTGVNTKGPDMTNYSGTTGSAATHGGTNNTRTGVNQVNRNNLPQVGTSSTQSVTSDLQTRITSAIKGGNPAIQNIYFVTKAG